LGDLCEIFNGTPLLVSSYTSLRTEEPTNLGAKKSGEKAMKEAKDVLRVVGMILLGLFVFTVGVPLVLKVAGLTLGIIGVLIGLAILLIKVAVVLAIGYLILVGIRALLR
jgi:hypothetical protein